MGEKKSKQAKKTNNNITLLAKKTNNNRTFPTKKKSNLEVKFNKIKIEKYRTIEPD
jgi:hypothetical protein